jgi:hypothetical protein
VHFGGVRKPLQEEVAGDSILVISELDGSNFIGGHMARVCWVRVWLSACEVSPVVCHLHCVAKTHFEDHPIGTAWL